MQIPLPLAYLAFRILILVSYTACDHQVIRTGTVTCAFRCMVVFLLLSSRPNERLFFRGYGSGVLAQCIRVPSNISLSICYRSSRFRCRKYHFTNRSGRANGPLPLPPPSTQGAHSRYSHHGMRTIIAIYENVRIEASIWKLNGTAEFELRIPDVRNRVGASRC